MSARNLVCWGAGAIGVWYFWPQIRGQLSAFGIPMMQPSGTAARDYIVAAFQNAGLSYNLGIAAAVNAYAESRWDPSAAAVWPEDSVGLFQLNAVGLGRGVSLARVGTDHAIDPADPRLFAQTQCDVVIQACKGNSVIMSMAPTASAHALTAAFCEQIERPANSIIEGGKRAAMVDTLFPGVI